jgi:hypothetical protein
VLEFFFLPAFILAQQSAPRSTGTADRLQQDLAIARGRAAMVEQIIDAARRGDDKKLAAIKVLGVKYLPEPRDRSARSPGGSKVAAFSSISLRRFASCRASRPQGSGIDWVTVQWDCSTATTPKNLATAFRFDAMRVVEIETVHGAPSIRPQ